MTCGASRDDRFLESKNRSANHSVLHPCAAPMRGREKKIHVVMADIDTCGRMAEGRALPGHRFGSKRAEIQHRACPDAQSSELRVDES